MPADPTPTALPPEGELVPPESVAEPASVRSIVIIAAVLLLSLWLVGEGWAHTFGAVGGCGGG
jgi:hypothetical protein